MWLLGGRWGGARAPCETPTVPSQSLQSKSYNHFAAIYYLLVERLKAHRCSFPVEQRLDGRQRRPSTVAEQTVVKVTRRPPHGTTFVGVS